MQDCCVSCWAFANAAQISRDPLVGSIFENLVVIEALKKRYNNGEMAGLYFFRDNHGNEVDLVAQKGQEE